MKTSTIILGFFLSIVFNVKAQPGSGPDDKVVKIDSFPYLHKYQNLYIGGQPSLEELRWLKSQEVNKIINLRTDIENIEYSEYAYNEQYIVQELGFAYYSITVNGIQDYTPEKLEAISAQMNDNEKILLHCRTAGRATQFFMAYLIKLKGYSIREAVEIGKKINFSIPLEQILDIEIIMERK
jgi:protein tyrosine phosphatase (PTP) superfamily phosphohydrolase (DUF442 family)